ncbi:tetratricopeptide repeat protein [Pendulispora albinea]|uniref:Tetratricopeptide repeat protein n=1 Tax=Pendulispora albinea TaxID=2741071 RepID=A0ABZ2M2I9_9BACT
MRKIARVGTVAAVFALLALPAPLRAAPGRETVKAAAERSVQPSSSGSSTPNLPRGGREQGRRSAIPVIKGTRVPDAMREQLRASLEARIDRNLAQIKTLRQEALGLLTTFVQESPRDSAEMPEALLRLGELKWEAERDAFIARFKTWETRPPDQRGPTPEPNYQPARELFGRVLRDYPAFTDYDLALYVDGFLATEQGKSDEALTRFERILKEYPRSRFTPDAHMAKAESLFYGKYDYPGALAEYEQVLRFKNSDLYGLALFKSAWCHWRIGNSDEAARRFVSVFEVTDTRGKAATTAQRKQLDELQGEALKYLVEVFTEDERNTASDVHGFLTKIGGERFAGKVVRALAETFFDQAHYERSIEAYELLLKLEPTSRDAGLWVLRIAACYSIIEDYPRLRATYARALTGYTAGSSWAKSQTDPQVVGSTTAAIEAQLREHAVNLHGKAQRDKTSRAEFEGAAGLYEVYLSRFGSSPTAYQIHFYLGDIYFYHLDKDTDAATHYMLAARRIPDAEAQREPLKTMRHDAIYNALAALERVRFAELDRRKKTGGAAQESEADKKFAEALDLYAQLYPNDPALPELFFRQGRLYYDNGVYDSAVKIWGALLEKFPRSQYAHGAGELILDSFNRSKDYENIETWARRLKTAPAFQDAQTQRKLDALIVQAVFKQGEQKVAAGDHAGAAKAYLRAAREFPRDPRAAQACVNAELAAQKAGDFGTLKEAAVLVTGREYKDKPESPLGAWTAATTFQSMGLYAEAAEFDETIASSNTREYPNYQRFEHTKDAAHNAVVLRSALGENDKTVANGNRYLAQYGTTSDSDEVVFLMGQAHQNAGRHREATELYHRYLSKTKNLDHRVQGYVLLALAQIQMRDEKGAGESLKSAVALGKRHKGELGPDGRYAAARARYLEGERILNRFDKIQIQGDTKQLSSRLKEKAELLKQASTVFLDTVSLGVAEWTTAALYQIGHAYESFAKSLREAPVPPSLSAADKEVYSQQIESFVVPMEERSIDSYETGWKKALDLGIYNRWTAKMREALGRLNGELYPPLRETGFDVRTVSAAPFPPLFEAPRRGEK